MRWGWAGSPGRRAWLWVLTLLLLAVLVWVLGRGTTERPVRPEIGVTAVSEPAPRSTAGSSRGRSSQAANTPAPAAVDSKETPARE